MTILDRYILALFLKIFLVCFVSFTGLFVVVHLFSNLDEMTALSKLEGWRPLLTHFYGPRVAEVFDKTSAIWALVAAVFTVSLLQRRQEMTAMEGAGVSRMRILRSLFVCGFAITLLAVVNREWVLPRMKTELAQTAQNWNAPEAIPRGVHFDAATGFKIRAKVIAFSENKLVAPEVQVPADISPTVPIIQADWAILTAADHHHPAGLLMHRIKQPASLEGLGSFQLEGRTVVFWPDGASWLKKDQAFVVCDYDPLAAVYGKKRASYRSIRERLVDIRKPKLWFGKHEPIDLHAQLIRPVLDYSLLLLGLPLIVRRQNRNIFVSVGLCFLIIASLHVTMLTSHSLGNVQMIQPAALAAWLPAIIIVPLAVVSLARLNR